MKINLSGHHVELSDANKEYIEEKLAKLAGHFPTLIAIDVIVAKEHGHFQVEMVTNYEGSRIAASGDNEVMYPAISKGIKKLEAALQHRKGQLKTDLHKKPQPTSPEIAHEHVQEMKLS